MRPTEPIDRHHARHSAGDVSAVAGLAALVLAATRPLSHLLKISNPAALYFMLVVGLTSLWIPVTKGCCKASIASAALGWMQITEGWDALASCCCW